MSCPACGAPIGAEARFCATCGHALRGHEDERRVVTVLFADLVGFTALSEQLDPERVKILVDRCFDRLAAEITAFGGRVDKIVGDAIIALFGAPVAHEDDAERAVRTALRLHEVVAAEAADSAQLLRLRIGINTGEVLVGAMRAAGSITAMGDVVNTAARLQTAADPGQVLVGPATYEATRGSISYRSQGPLEVKGRTGSVEAYEAVAPTAAPGSRRRRDDVALVGRDHEIALLRHAVHTSLVHERAVLGLLVADVGMGKSRLADEIARWATTEHGVATAEGRCLPYGEANVWWPVADALRGAVGVDVGASEADARTSVADAVDRVLPAVHPDDVDGTQERDRDVQRVTAGLLSLLGFEDTSAAVEPAAVREEISRALGVYLNSLAAIRPVVFQVSDLHWADEALLGLIDDVIAIVANRPIALLATARPDLLDRWQPSPGRHNAIVLHLDPLDRASAAQLLAELADGPLPDDVVAEVLDRSGGNPFFMEELVSLLGDPDRGEVDALPATLRGLVAARLDGLDASARALLQDASVLGQRGLVQGLREMAAHLHGHRVDDVGAALDALEDEGILDVEAGRWSFRSDLVREVTYQTVTKADRAKAHHGIARWLEHGYADRRPRPSWLVDQLAHHLGTAATLGAELGSLGRSATLPADLPAKARRWTLAAAASARRDQAMPTAIQRYDQAIALADLDPEVTDLDRAELHVLRADAGVEGWDLAVAEESVAAIERLVPADGSSPRAAALAIGGRIEQRRGNPDRAIELLVEAEEAYGRLGLVPERSVALRHLALVQIFAGRTAAAEESAERARAGFEAIGDAAGQGWAVQHLAWISFVNGDRDGAASRVARARALFRAVNDTRGEAWADGLDAWIQFQSHRIDEAADLAVTVLAEARSRRDPWATPMMTMLLASIRLWTGRTEEAVELGAEARRGFVAIADPYGIDQASAVLGRSLVMAGRVDEGEAHLAEMVGPMAAGARAAVAAQLGEPHRVDRSEIADAEALFNGELAVTRGLLALQEGDVEGAGADLDPSRRPDAGADVGEANLRAAQALWSSAAGRDGAAELAASVDADPASTYLDRAAAHLASALRAAEVGDGAVADHHLQTSRSLIEPTGDRVLRQLHQIVAVGIARRLGPEPLGSGRVGDLLEPSWDLPGVEAEGWRRVVDLALGASRTPPA
jgi:class 3 adenylate cyclase/tetratricopeptide (TPR) repeat protein